MKKWKTKYKYIAYVEPNYTWGVLPWGPDVLNYNFWFKVPKNHGKLRVVVQEARPTKKRNAQ